MDGGSVGRNLFLGCLAVAVRGWNAAHLQGGGVGIRDAIVRIPDLQFARAKQRTGADGSNVSRQPESANFSELLDDFRLSRPHRYAGACRALDPDDRVVGPVDPEGALHQELAF